MKDPWEPDICGLDEVPEGGARGFSVTGEDGVALRLIVVRRLGDIRVYENRCPHRGTPLDWAPDRFLDETGEFLVCSTHAALFRIEDGACVSGPCPGEFLKARNSRLFNGRLLLTDSAEKSPPPED
ncbi:MAG: Rieske (2Fe-2S) protein [Myxococcota bacterium]|jgi:nitrite reductase/ring-hydroxylating ferredoxin subunit|nr:Rieske (2Fe-2S) protein [Myxococcota bacterium]